MVGESREQEFVAETVRMASAPQKHEQASHFRFRGDNYLASQKKRSRECAVKFGSVAIRSRIDSIRHSYLQDSSLGQSI